MARPTKWGSDYYPMRVGFFGDKDVRILMARYHADGIAVYLKILDDAYAEGYYISVNCWEDYLFIMADMFHITVDKVEQIITFLHNRAMVRVYRKDELTGYELDAVITSHGIQKRYAFTMKSRKKSVDEIRRGFWLLTEEEEREIYAFYKNDQNGDFSEKNYNFSEKNPRFSEKNSLNKIKENKIKENIKRKESYTPFSRPAVFPQDERAVRERWYSERKAKAERAADVVEEEMSKDTSYTLCKKRLKEIEFQTAKAEIEQDGSKKDFLTAEKETLLRERERLLRKRGYTSSDLTPKYHCPKCSDTGFLPNGKACDCYEGG